MKKLHSLLWATLCAVSFNLASAQTERASATPIHAFIWGPHKGMQDLGTLGGDNSYALGINDRGTVVGYSYLADNVTFHAFLWFPDRGLVDIGARIPGDRNSWGVSINASDSVASTAFPGDGSAVAAAFVFPSLWRRFPFGSGSSLNRSYGINDLNQVTGQNVIGFKTGFLWDVATSAVTYLPTLPGGGDTIGVAVNNLSHVTGAGTTSSYVYDALFWSAETGSVDIGSLNQSAFSAGGGINDHDEVVGYNLPELGGFYWTKATGMQPLRSLGGSVSAAFSINSSGNIVGYGGLADGTIHATRWKSYRSAPQDLGTLNGSGNSYAKGINSAGQVAGYSEVP